MSSWKIAKLAKIFPGNRPSQLLKVKKTLRSLDLGLSKLDLQTICLDFDLMMMEQLEWVESRENAREEVDAPKRDSKRTTMMVPKYRTVESLLALDVDPEQDHRRHDGVDTERLSASEIRERAKQLLADPNAALRFLQKE